MMADPTSDPAASRDTIVADLLAPLFATVLGLASAEPETDFYLAGGHSLAALDLAVAIEAETGLRVGVTDILECPTPMTLAARLASSGRATKVRPGNSQTADLVAGTPAVTISDPAAGPSTTAPAFTAPLDREARWLWLERQRSGRLSDAYTVSCLLEGQGKIDPRLFATAVAAAVGLHPALHCVVHEIRGEPIAVQTGPPAIADVLEVETAAEHDIEALPAIVFDPAIGPLIRVRLLLEPEAWQVQISADHLVCDGRSLELLAYDIVEAYNRPGVRGPRVARQQQPATADSDLDYWRDRMVPAPPALPLPVSAPRAGVVGETSATVSLNVPAGSVDALIHSGHAALFVPAAAAVARVLADLTGLRDVCLGTAVDRRARNGAQSRVGCLVTTVPLRILVPPTNDNHRLVAEVAAASAGAVDHSAVSFDEIVAAVDPPRTPGRTPLFDVWVAVFPTLDAPASVPDGIALHGSPLPVRTAVFELSFQFVRHSSGLNLHLLYDLARYSSDTAARIATRVVAMLVQLADDLAGGGIVASPGPGPEQDLSRDAAAPPPLFAGFRLEE